jgi:hypothetical protein
VIEVTIAKAERAGDIAGSFRFKWSRRDPLRQTAQAAVHGPGIRS